MEFYADIKNALVALGFTPDRIAPLLVLCLVAWYLVKITVKGSTESIGKEIRNIKKATYRMEEFIIRLCGAIESGGSIEKITLYEKNSPIKLTKEGLNEIEKIGFKNDIDNNLHQLFEIIERFKPNSAYDVEQVCVGLIRYVMTDRSLDIFRNTENYLYNNPDYNNPEYFKAAGIYLRDEYFKKFPEILSKST